MRFNFNKILNEKHALKGLFGRVKGKTLFVDLHNDLTLGLHIPKMYVYLQLNKENKPLSSFGKLYSWNVVLPYSLNDSSVSFLHKPMVDVNPSKSFIMIDINKDKVKTNTSFFCYKDGFKGDLLSKKFICGRFLKFRRTVLSKSNLSNILYYLDLHSKTNFIFQRPSISCINSKISSVYDKQNIGLAKTVEFDYRILSKACIYSSFSKKFCLDVVKRKTVHSKSINQKYSRLFVVLNYLKKKSLSFNAANRNKLINLIKTHSEKALKISQTKILLQNFLKLNETNKKKVKATVETANVEFIKSDLFKIKSDYFAKFKSLNKFRRSKRSKKFYKRKGKDFIESNSELATAIYKKLQDRNKSKSSTISKSKLSKTSKFKSKVPRTNMLSKSKTKN